MKKMCKIWIYRINLIVYFDWVVRFLVILYCYLENYIFVFNEYVFKYFFSKIDVVF